MGTLAAIPLYLVLVQTPDWVYLLITCLVTLLGITICDKAAQILQEHDYGGIVWDEIAGLFITLCWIPFSWQNLLAGFILFRFFDILKPWPIKWLDQQVQGGFGIMLDDVVAAVFAAVLLRFWL